MSSRRFVHIAVVCAAVPALLVACGDDDSAPIDSPPPIPELPSVDAPTTVGTVGGSGGEAAPADPGDHEQFCARYEQLEARFETTGAATIEETRAQLAALADDFEELRTDVPAELSDDWSTLVNGIDELVTIAGQAPDNEALQATIYELPVAPIDGAGRVVEEWSRANC